jgi:methionine synthase II (cobalamin-independent)
VAAPEVQLVTHLCYSDFNDIMAAVDNMDGEWQSTAYDSEGPTSAENSMPSSFTMCV